MIYPNPPAPSGFNFKGECDRRMSRDRARSPQHGDAIFRRETNFFFILFTIILYAADRRARGQKVCFFSEYLCFLFGLTPAIRRYIFCRDSPSPRRVRGMVSDEGGGAPLPPWCR